MRVAIGSTRDLKVQAVKKVWPVFASKLLGDPDESVEFVSYDVSKATTVQMPLSAAQLMESALDRVESLNLQLKREKTESDFYVGLEDGFNIVKKTVYAGRYFWRAGRMFQMGTRDILDIAEASMCRLESPVR